MISEHLLQRADDPPIRTTVEVRKRHQPVREIRPPRTLGRFGRDPGHVAAQVVCFASQKPLRSCHKWLESAVAPISFATGKDCFRGSTRAAAKNWATAESIVLSTDYMGWRKSSRRGSGRDARHR
jgi:hypothetical protein